MTRNRRRPEPALNVRARLTIEGTVQGVGFRPFVYRAARGGRLGGFVRNTPRGVEVEVEGPAASVESLLRRMSRHPPPLARVDRIDVTYVPTRGESRFRILDSTLTGAREAPATPDAATCALCQAELWNAEDRRHRYPFTNCTECGPRFSIVRDIPYDRPGTTMRGFTMCTPCREEYHDPLSRRFHAQPNACPDCGPRLALLDASGTPLGEGDDALRRAEQVLLSGGIVALKGLGGFQLLCHARQAEAVLRLRSRKRREEKPFAIMVASIEAARLLCTLSRVEEEALASPQAPILLARRRVDARIAAEAVAPRSRILGLMLPYTPLHHLIACDLDVPFVATSGNRVDEPIARDTEEALERLGDIADCFLVHDRPIARRVDDTVGRVVAGRFRVLRRARGFAPEPVRAGAALPRILAVGAHQKAVVGIALRDRVVLSQHLGDLDTPLAREGFEQAVRDLLRLYRFEPERVACDLHPDYASTRFAEALGCPVERVQHHHAHAASCLVDAGRWDGSEALAVTWDGTGYGTDGTVWGGEFLAVRGAEFRRVAQLRPFRLPGGDAAAREPARVLVALLWEMAGDNDGAIARAPEVQRHLKPREVELLLGMLRRGVNSPVTTSMGRLFDAMAALSGLRRRASFEGQAAMELEQALDPRETGAYPLPVRDGDPLVLDWGPLVESARADLRAGVDPGTLSARFHNALVEATAAVAGRVDLHAVALTGGCFQNATLTERTAERLSRCGFEVLLHRQVPPNDGGIALGQIAIAAARQASGRAGIPCGKEDRRVPGGTG